MKYTVVWADEATADLMDIWASSIDKAAVTAAARFIDLVLEHEPLQEEVVGGFGTVIRAPVGVDFWLDGDNRRNFVTAAWPVSERE